MCSFVYETQNLTSRSTTLDKWPDVTTGDEQREKTYIHINNLTGVLRQVVYKPIKWEELLGLKDTEAQSLSLLDLALS